MEVVKKDKILFKDVPSKFPAARYHSWIADKESLPNELEITAVDEEGGIMAIRHKEYMVSAVQFHPESILTNVGEQIVRNFINEAHLNLLKGKE
jgi:anthranilate synthase component 2